MSVRQVRDSVVIPTLPVPAPAKGSSEQGAVSDFVKLLRGSVVSRADRSDRKPAGVSRSGGREASFSASSSSDNRDQGQSSGSVQRTGASDSSRSGVPVDRSDSILPRVRGEEDLPEDDRLQVIDPVDAALEAAALEAAALVIGGQSAVNPDEQGSDKGGMDQSEEGGVLAGDGNATVLPLSGSIHQALQSFQLNKSATGGDIAVYSDIRADFSQNTPVPSGVSVEVLSRVARSTARTQSAPGAISQNLFAGETGDSRGVDQGGVNQMNSIAEAALKAELRSESISSVRFSDSESRPLAGALPRVTAAGSASSGSSGLTSLSSPGLAGSSQSSPDNRGTSPSLFDLADFSAGNLSGVLGNSFRVKRSAVEASLPGQLLNDSPGGAGASPLNSSDLDQTNGEVYPGNRVGTAGPDASQVFSQSVMFPVGPASEIRMVLPNAERTELSQGVMMEGVSVDPENGLREENRPIFQDPSATAGLARSEVSQSQFAGNRLGAFRGGISDSGPLRGRENRESDAEGLILQSGFGTQGASTGEQVMQPLGTSLDFNDFGTDSGSEQGGALPSEDSSRGVPYAAVGQAAEIRGQAAAPASSVRPAQEMSRAEFWEQVREMIQRVRSENPSHLSVEVQLADGATVGIELRMRSSGLEASFRSDSNVLLRGLESQWAGFLANEAPNLQIASAAFESRSSLGNFSDSGRGGRELREQMEDAAANAALAGRRNENAGNRNRGSGGKSRG